MAKLFIQPVKTIKLTPGGSTAHESAESVIDFESNTQVDAVREKGKKYIMSKGDIRSEIEEYKKTHVRPISEKEYEKYYQMILTSVTPDDEMVYDYEKAALSRVITENYRKFKPDVVLPSEIVLYRDLPSEMSVDFLDLYFDALEKYRKSFITKKSLKSIEKKETKPAQFIHPMMKYSLIGR